MRKISPGSFCDETSSPNNFPSRAPVFNRSLSSPSQMTKTPIQPSNNNNNNRVNKQVDPENKKSEVELEKIPDEVPDSAEDIMSTSRAAIESETAANQSDGCMVS